MVHPDTVLRQNVEREMSQEARRYLKQLSEKH
jgi:hypothetical protein